MRTFIFGAFLRCRFQRPRPQAIERVACGAPSPYLQYGSVRSSPAPRTVPESKRPDSENIVHHRTEKDNPREHCGSKQSPAWGRQLLATERAKTNSLKTRNRLLNSDSDDEETRRSRDHPQPVVLYRNVRWKIGAFVLAFRNSPPSEKSYHNSLISQYHGPLNMGGIRGDREDRSESYWRYGERGPDRTTKKTARFNGPQRSASRTARVCVVCVRALRARLAVFQFLDLLAQEERLLVVQPPNRPLHELVELGNLLRFPANANNGRRSLVPTTVPATA